MYRQYLKILMTLDPLREFFDGSWRQGHTSRTMPTGFLTVKQVAERLGVDRSRVNALIKAGKLEAEKFGQAWAIPETSLRAFEASRNRKAGRPRKPK